MHKGSEKIHIDLKLTPKFNLEDLGKKKQRFKLSDQNQRNLF